MKARITGKAFAMRFVGCSAPLWSMVLSCERNLGFSKARKVAELLDTPVELWMDPDASSEERLSAWVKYQENFRDAA